jgi:hypothetical protein
MLARRQMCAAPASCFRRQSLGPDTDGGERKERALGVLMRVTDLEPKTAAASEGRPGWAAFVPAYSNDLSAAITI